LFSKRLIHLFKGILKKYREIVVNKLKQIEIDNTDGISGIK
jgi:hypothetical protein